MTPPAGPAQPPPQRRARRVRRGIDGVRGVLRLALEGVGGASGIAEEVHRNVSRLVPTLGAGPRQPSAIARFVYQAVRTGSALSARALDATMARVALPGDGADVSAEGEAPGWVASRSVLNGLLGDHLVRTGNPLAQPMEFRLPSSRGPRLLLLVHGLCMNDLQWSRGGHDHGRMLARAGWSPVYLRYNTGLHISRNGAELAAMLEALVAGWPVPVRSMAIVGHSMGGLVARSAVHCATGQGMKWPDRLRQMVFLGTPHHGAVLERGANWLHAGLGISRYAAPFARLAALRSDGITDLRHGNLADADWERGKYAHRDTRIAIPLPAGVAAYAVAGLLPGNAKVLGDGLVTVDSALGRHRTQKHDLHLPGSHVLVVRGAGHLDLLSNPQVARRLKKWLAVVE